MTASYITPYGNLTYWTNTDPQSLVSESATSMASVRDAFNNVSTALSTSYALKGYRWANAAARTAQTGMVEGDIGDQLDSNIRYRYDGAAWRVNSAGQLPVIPTATGTGVSVSASGLITLTNATDIAINNAFTSDMSHYLIIIEVTSTSASSISATLRAGGSNATGASYTYRRRYTSGSAVVADGGTASGIPMSALAGTDHVYRMEISTPATARNTRFSTRDNTVNAGVANVTEIDGLYTVTTSFDGLRLLDSQPLTGTIRIYGWMGT